VSPAEEPFVYVVDDDPVVVEAVAHFLRSRGYKVRGFQDPTQARDAIRANGPQLLITDRYMPGLGGFDLARIALEEDPDIAVVVLTVAREVESAIEAFRLGVADYLLQPLDLGAVENAVRRVLTRRAQEIFHRQTESQLRKEMEARSQELERQTKLLEGVTVGALTALVRILEGRTPSFAGHSQAVSRLSERLATQLNLTSAKVRACKVAGFLHDIGMIAIPDWILEKAGPLTPAESARIQDHCRIGKEILPPFSHLGPVPDYVYFHHERVDGSGYPTGLKGAEIPLGAQIVAVADSFQALVESRPYRPAYTPGEATEILLGTAGVWHTSELPNAFARVLRSSSG
jgi:putative two-component system response regulator